MQNNTNDKRYWLPIFALSLLSILPAHAGNLEHAIETQVNTDLAAQESQQHIDSLSDETIEMLAEYRDVLNQTESLRAYNDQLDTLVSSQETELNSIEQQLQNIETTQRDIVPLMIKMIDVMAQFVALDLPFLPEERQTRIIQLQTLMDRADVSLAEKYRRILEAYQVETEYGRTIEAYQDELQIEGASRTVDFLRIGRVSLYYLTLDGLEAGMWNVETQQWIQLSANYLQPIAQGLKVALKQLPPDLLVLPVQTMEVAQ
jgi:DNA-binding transcriptional regulator/RsmH inhibitor MraZ